MNRFARLAIASCMILLTACGGGELLFTVRYEASGPAPLDVSYTIPGGETTQERLAAGSFSREFLVRRGEALFVSGQSAGLNFVVATISVNGSVLRAGTARGAATAAATCCE